LFKIFHFFPKPVNYRKVHITHMIIDKYLFSILDRQQEQNHDKRTIIFQEECFYPYLPYSVISYLCTYFLDMTDTLAWFCYNVSFYYKLYYIII